MNPNRLIERAAFSFAAVVLVALLFWIANLTEQLLNAAK